MAYFMSPFGCGAQLQPDTTYHDHNFEDFLTAFVPHTGSARTARPAAETPLSRECNMLLGFRPPAQGDAAFMAAPTAEVFASNSSGWSSGVHLGGHGTDEDSPKAPGSNRANPEDDDDYDYEEEEQQQQQPATQQHGRGGRRAGAAPAARARGSAPAKRPSSSGAALRSTRSRGVRKANSGSLGPSPAPPGAAGMKAGPWFTAVLGGFGGFKGPVPLAAPSSLHTLNERIVEVERRHSAA